MNFCIRKTRVVKVGKIGIGGKNPIRIQSMTNTNPLDIKNTVKQIVSLHQAGCEIVRLTIPDKDSALALKEIKIKLKEQNIKIPLVADIHFNRTAAIIAAEYADKIRINPGNFAKGDLKDIQQKFIPLIKKLKEKKIALRIGVNHGSLSKRIVEKYGNTVKGMVASALEYIKIAEQNSYFDIIVSIKSSIPEIMIEAYNKLINEMDKHDMNYPLHLGVTEAGNGQEGRIKSCCGLGSLLLDGYGNTIRVSLTEPPENEIPVAKKIIQITKQAVKKTKTIQSEITTSNKHHSVSYMSPFKEHKINYGLKLNKSLSVKDFPSLGIIKKGNDLIKKDQSVDFIISNNDKNNLDSNIPVIKLITKGKKRNSSLINLNKKNIHLTDKIIQTPTLILKVCDKNNFYFIVDFFLEFLKKIKLKKSIVLIYKSQKLIESDIINFSMQAGKLLSKWNNIQGILIENNKISLKQKMAIAFDLFQATKKRITQTEYISCPTCGRTSFNLQNAINKIKKQTSHLKGLKIAVMGCIVNGPGEMGDADYGYIGNKSKKITLFKGKTIIKQNIDPNLALPILLEQIKTDGKWTTPE